MTTDPKILSIATAIPSHRVDQQTAKDFARVMFEGLYKSLEKN